MFHPRTTGSNHHSALFSDKEVNTGRQMQVDMAKMFAIFFMVIIHTFEGGDADMETGLGYFFDSIAGAQFGAPVFMIGMGIGITFSHKSDAATMAKRGWMLFLAGYLLNILRALPFPILYGIYGEEEYVTETIHALTDVDIFQFAGMAFLLIALIKRLHLSMGWAGLLAAVMSVAGSFVHKVDLGCFWANLLASPFIGIDTEWVASDFPLINWFGFVMVGYGVGKILRRCEAPDRLNLIVLPVAALVYGGYAAYAVPRGIGMFSTDSTEFYHMNSLDFIICVAAAMLAMSLCHFITHIISEKLMTAVTHVCADLTKIYIAQWLIIMWVVRAIMTDCMELQLGQWGLLVVGIIILLLSIGWARLKPLSKLKM